MCSARELNEGRLGRSCTKRLSKQAVSICAWAAPTPLPQVRILRSLSKASTSTSLAWAILGAKLSPDCILASMLSRSEEHTSELQSRGHLVCRLLLEKKKNKV